MGDNTAEPIIVNTHDEKEWHRGGKVDIPDTVCDCTKLEHLVSGYLGGPHVDGGKGANIVKAILGMAGVLRGSTRVVSISIP